MADWTTEVGALAVYICDAAKVHHIVFRNIRVRQESNYAICCVITRDKWSSDERAGQVEDILFEDIMLPENYSIYLRGFLKSIRSEICVFREVILKTADSTWKGWNL